MLKLIIFSIIRIQRIYIRNLILCLHFIMNFFLIFNRLASLYFNIHTSSFTHILHLSCKLFVEVDLFIIFQCIIGVSPSSFKCQLYLERAVYFFTVGFLYD